MNDRAQVFAGPGLASRSWVLDFAGAGPDAGTGLDILPGPGLMPGPGLNYCRGRALVFCQGRA